MMKNKCEKCGEHTLECQCEKLNVKIINGKFYYEGKYFDKEEDFWKYIKEWSFLPLDAETANRHLDTIKKDILMNIFLRDIEMNNGEFKEFLNCVFEFAMKELQFHIYKE